MKRIQDDDNPNMGFQIAPMIDVVFVIMLFFMVMAGAVKVEHELKTALPGSTPPQAADVKDVPDEITIVVAEDGTVITYAAPGVTCTSEKDVFPTSD